MKRRHLILLIGGASSGTMSVGTGAFSSMEADRGVEVNVVSDDEAFVGYHAPKSQPENDDPVTNGDRITLVEVRNRFSDHQEISLVGVQIEEGHGVLTSYEVERKLPESADEKYEVVNHVAIEEGDTEPTSADAPQNGFNPGEYERITAEVQGIDPDEDVEIEVTVTLRGVAGTGVAAELFGDTRAFTITGGESDDPLSGVTGVEFPGDSGNPKLKPDDGGAVQARAYFRDESDTLDKTTFHPIQFGESLRTKHEFHTDDNHTIIGIEIKESGKVYRRSDASSGEKLVTEPVDRNDAFD